MVNLYCDSPQIPRVC